MAMRILFFFVLLFQLSWSYSNIINDSIIIQGVGSYYKNAIIEIFSIDDYITNTEKLIESKRVDSIGYFEFRLKRMATQKLVIRSKKNSSFLYVQPGGKYLITIAEKNEYDEKNPNGNHVDLIFYQLDSSDINYKILRFERWMDKELGDFYHLKKINPKEYEKRYRELKRKADIQYSNDTNVYFLCHYKYSLAETDDLEIVSSQTRLQNYVKWFSKFPVFYRNVSYMNYFNAYYQNLFLHLDNSVKNNLYEAVINRSPSLAMQALSEDVELKNIQIRELALLKLLYEQCYEKRYPKSNVLFILDSIKQKSKFPEHRKIASNVIDRVTELSIGSRFPDFKIQSTKGDTLSNIKLEGKHIYFHFYDPFDEKCQIEFPPLVKLHQAYGEYVQFISIAITSNGLTKDLELPWNQVIINQESDFIKSLKILNYPSYVLLDATGNIVANPALGPIPKNDYETIEPTFFQIKRIITGERRRK
jgi:hypothetical protein